MFEEETRILIILRSDLVDRARGLAGRATISMKLPVSLQIVLRALIEEGLKHSTDPALMDNIGRQAETIRQIRRAAPGRAMARAAGRPVRSRARS